MRLSPAPVRSRTRGARTGTGPRPVMIARSGRCPWLKPKRLVEPDSSAHLVGGECDGAKTLDHDGTLSLFSQGSARPWKPGSKPGRDGGLKAGREIKRIVVAY